MASLGSVTVEVVPTISAESAMACVKLVEMYVNASNADLILQRLPDGRYSLSIVEGAHDES